MCHALSLINLPKFFHAKVTCNNQPLITQFDTFMVCELVLISKHTRKINIVAAGLFQDKTQSIFLRNSLIGFIPLAVIKQIIIAILMKKLLIIIF